MVVVVGGWGSAVALGRPTGCLACQSFGKLLVFSGALRYHFKLLGVNKTGVVTYTIQ